MFCFDLWRAVIPRSAASMPEECFVFSFTVYVVELTDFYFVLSEPEAPKQLRPLERSVVAVLFHKFSAGLLLLYVCFSSTSIYIKQR